MSYILDALKKSDQLRQRGTAPTLWSAQSIPIEYRPPAVPYYGALALLLLGVGIAVGWRHPWHRDRTASDAEAVVDARPTPAYTPPTPARAPSASIAVEHPSHQTTPAPEPRPATTKPRTDPPRRHATPLPVQTRAPEPPHAEPQQPTSQTPAAAPGSGVVSMAELPAAIRRELPKLAISAFLYSADPQGRMVGVNDQLLREGDYFGPGIRLEAILPDGMIFSFKKYRFRYDAQ